LVWSARLGKVSVDGERRRLVVTDGELRSQFEDLEASRQACVDEKVAGDEAKLQSFTAMLEVALIGDDEDDRSG
jgi:hypothetical protein